MERKPSEIFLDLWHHRATLGMEREDFIKCAEAWAEIRASEQAMEWNAELLEREMKALDIPPERQCELFGIKMSGEPKPEC